MELLRGLLKWIVLAIIIIVIIVLIVRFANRTESQNNTPTEPTVNIVERGNQSNDDADTNDSLEPLQENLTVDSPDTASNGIKETILGLIILGFGIHYVYKRRNVKENS